MAEVWHRIREVGGRMWRSVTEETPRQERGLFTPPSFYPFRGFDNPADIGVAALFEASLRREQKGQDGGSVDKDQSNVV